MLVGDAVTVVLRDGTTRPATVESFRDDGAVYCRWQASGRPAGTTVAMWVGRAWIDDGATDVFGRRLREHVAHLTQDQALVLGALFAAGNEGLIDHDHQHINAIPKAKAEKLRLQLAKQGLVERTHNKRSMGRALATVHRITPAGRAAWLNYQRSRSAA